MNDASRAPHREVGLFDAPFREALERKALLPRLREYHIAQCPSHCIFD